MTRRTKLLARVYRAAAMAIETSEDQWTCCAVVDAECDELGIPRPGGQDGRSVHRESGARALYVWLMSPERRNNSTRGDEELLQGGFEGWTDVDFDRYQELSGLAWREQERDRRSLRALALHFMAAIAAAGDL